MKTVRLLGVLGVCVALTACSTMNIFTRKQDKSLDGKQVASAQPRVDVTEDAAVEATGLGQEETLNTADDGFGDERGMTTVAKNEAKPAQARPVSQATRLSQQQKDAVLNQQCKADLCFFFDFDKSELHRNVYTALEAQARYLSSHPNLTLRLEGNTDERGSREYNLALGERRANAVAELLELQGARRTQLKVVSNGQEKPLALGHTPRAWSENRRVDLYICTANQPRCR